MEDRVVMWVFLSSIRVRNVFKTSNSLKTTRLIILKCRQQHHSIGANNREEHLPLASSLCPNDFPMTLGMTPRKSNLIGGETLESGLGRHWEKGQKSKCEVTTSTYNKITTLSVQNALYFMEIQVIYGASSDYVSSWAQSESKVCSITQTCQDKLGS